MLCYLIDDDQDDRDFFALALEEIDPEIRLATSGDATDAIRKLSSGDQLPDVIFLDINMPRIDGWECLRLLRDLNHLSGVPIVIYSTSENSTRTPEKDGFHAFLTKQTKISDLTERLKDVLSGIKN